MSPSLGRLREFYVCASKLGTTPRQRGTIFWRLTKNFRARLGLSRYHPDVVYPLATALGIVFLRDNFGDVTNLYDLLVENVYCFLPEMGGVVLDVGANIGLFAAWVERTAPGSQIHCFEPLAGNTRLIPMNCPSAVVNCCAVGRERKTLELQVDGQGIMASAISTPWSTTGQGFSVIPLDEYTRDRGIHAVSFMKVDTEGMELEVFEGGRETLRRTTRVSVETHGDERHRGVLALLRDGGFRIDQESFGGKTGLVIASRSAPRPS